MTLGLLLLLAQFYCPMHPDQQSATPEKCAVCGMPMVALPPARFVTYPVDFRVTATTGGARLRLAVRDPRTRATVRTFTLVHERSMHLFVVGGDLEFFAHEHPVQQADGVFIIDVALPKAGPYMAIAEFLPAGATPQVFQRMFTTGEAFAGAAAPAVDTAAKTVDGVRVALDPPDATAGATRPLTFRFSDPASGAAVTDLQPYLGAAAHLLMVPVDLTEAIHGHPDELFHDGGVTFTPLIPRAGRYKLWIQFQRAGRVSTASFVIDVR
jgi:catechol 2,3-dioxygenase-like lactoylglutathione lyase family enzyme